MTLFWLQCTLSIRTSKHLLYYKLIEKNHCDLFVFKTMTVNFHWIFNCAFAFNKLKGRADSSPNLEIINLFYEADDLFFYYNASFFTAVVFNLVCFTVFFASWLVFFYENILLPISRCFLGKNAFSQWLLNER